MSKDSSKKKGVSIFKSKGVRITGKIAMFFWKWLLRPAIILCAVFIVFKFAYTKVEGYIVSEFLSPVEPGNTEEILVDIPIGSSVRSISTTLEEAGVIKHDWLFKLYVDISDNSYRLQSGKYVFNKSMSMADIMNEMLVGKNVIPTVTFTIPEGWTVYAIANFLSEDVGLNFTAEEFLAQAHPDNYPQFTFLDSIPQWRRDGLYPMEGYLFPDTYIVYEDATADDVISKMLNNMDDKLTSSLLKKTREMGMTVDELICFASVVQSESANAAEYSRIAAVFHNRNTKNMMWQSDATVFYMLFLNGEFRESIYHLYPKDKAVDSPYNCYMYKGAPGGPILNPGLGAIKGVLEPNEADMKSSSFMLYFILNPETGRTTFNATYAQHVEDTRKYNEWREQHGG